MYEIVNGSVELTCDCCESNLEMGYRVGESEEVYCEDCMLEYLKSEVCESIYVKEDGEDVIEVDEDTEGAEPAYRYNGDIYKDDDSGTFNEILLDDYVDDIITIEELEDDYESGILDAEDYDDDDEDEDYFDEDDE